MIHFVIPQLEDLWFKESLLADEATMAYNRKWGGTIPFSEERWGDWYTRWVEKPESKRFYRYLADENGTFVGEAAYHWDEEEQRYLADIIVMAAFRGKGYGTQGLRLLCKAAQQNGLKCLYDNIAIDNPGISVSHREGFQELYRTEAFICVKKEL